jgi:hypothetical protein
MNANTQVLCNLALTFGVPIVLAGWELWRLGPIDRRQPPDEDCPPEPGPLPDAGQLPRVQKPLPDCLVPRPSPVRVREPA